MLSWPFYAQEQPVLQASRAVSSQTGQKQVAANATTDRIVTLDVAAEQELVAEFRDGKRTETEHNVALM